MNQKASFDKYEYYQKSVQHPGGDADFIEKAYFEARAKHPRILREDFCAGYALCCEWVRRGPENQAIGVDLDPEPVEYGTAHYLSTLTQDQKSRVRIILNNVLNPELPNADVIAALNFSYYGFKKRTDLLQYFKACRQALGTNGILVLDCFGGSDLNGANEAETVHDDFSYFWDQENFNPITHEAMFHIHFKRKGEKKRMNVFTYDWRVWTIPELRDLMEEAGFKESRVYWEGTDEDGDGNGEFVRSETGEEGCESWVAYIVGLA